jgi:hypothetical protein
MKTINNIAERLVELLNDGQFVQAYEELFDENTESIDPLYKDQPVNKLSLLIEREKQFLSRATIHDIKASAPLIVGNYFVITLNMAFSVDEQEKQLGELCVYQVKEGKIISQQFFIS